MPPQTNDQLDSDVLFHLGYHIGKQNAADRWELVEKIYGVAVPQSERNDDNLFDREIRYAVGRLRLKGHLICDLGNGNGRWLAANEDEFWEFYAYYVKPIKSRAEVARALKAAAQERFPNLLQPSLFDGLEMV